jgi:hypothetical protein
MRFFTIHERPAQSGGDPPLLLPDVLAVGSGFSWWAAVFPPLWLLRHRLWLGLVFYMLFSILLGIALALGDIADPAATTIGLAISFLIGAGAADYRRWTLQRRGWRFGGVLRAASAVEAEEIYIRDRGAAIAPAGKIAPGKTSGLAQTIPPATRGTEAFPSLL